MEQLTGLDAAFLGMETSTVHGHVGSVCLLDPSTASEPLTLDRLTQLVGARLHLIPAFRRRLVAVPLGLDHPYWVEGPDLDLEFHVRELSLPAPGDDLQLCEQVARLHSRHLDRSRPLWELYLIHGLAGGRLAVYLKVHHATIDGVSGNDLIAALMDLTPSGREVEEPPVRANDRVPGAIELLARSSLSLATHPKRVVRIGYRLARSAPAIVSRPARRRLPIINRLGGREEDVVLPRNGRLRAPATPFNAGVSAHRRWAFRSLPFNDVKAVKDAYGATVNDVVMGLCAGALRGWLEKNDALPSAPLVAAVPVSIRVPGDDHSGNKISMMIAPIPTDIADAGERVRVAHEAMRSAKEVHGALPANLLADVAQFAMPALVNRAARLSARFGLLERANPFNLIISNVPGPQQPLYYAGARLLAYYPLASVTDGQGLNITVISYDGQMHFGLMADRALVRDLEVLADLLTAELDTLVVAAGRATK